MSCLQKAQPRGDANKKVWEHGQISESFQDISRGMTTAATPAARFNCRSQRCVISKHSKFVKAARQPHDANRYEVAAPGHLEAMGSTRERSGSLDRDKLEHLQFSPPELEALTLPPPTADGELLEVDFRMEVFYIGDVNTRDQNAKIKLGVVMYWTDPRMAGYTSPILPGTLWGPELFFSNCVGSVQCNYELFAVCDPDEGRLKRIIIYECVMQCSMDLRRFPFDWQVLCPTLVTISHWRQLDCARGGSISQGMTYKLVPLRRKDEGVFMWFFCSGTISEWLLHSYRPKMIVAKNPAGFTITKVMLSFNIARKSEFYLAKTTAPLAVLTTAGHFVHFLPTTELADRLNGAFTMFLAAIALLYVVGDHVPRVDFLTTIDRMIFITLGMLLWSCGNQISRRAASTRRCPRCCVCSMAWRFTKVSRIFDSLVDFHTGSGWASSRRPFTTGRSDTAFR